MALYGLSNFPGFDKCDDYFCDADLSEYFRDQFVLDEMTPPVGLDYDGAVVFVLGPEKIFFGLHGFSHGEGGFLDLFDKFFLSFALEFPTPRSESFVAFQQLS